MAQREVTWAKVAQLRTSKPLESGLLSFSTDHGAARTFCNLGTLCPSDSPFSSSKVSGDSLSSPWSVPSWSQRPELPPLPPPPHTYTHTEVWLRSVWSLISRRGGQEGGA